MVLFSTATACGAHKLTLIPVVGLFCSAGNDTISFASAEDDGGGLGLTIDTEGGFASVPVVFALLIIPVGVGIYLAFKHGLALCCGVNPEFFKVRWW